VPEEGVALEGRDPQSKAEKTVTGLWH
jgi:hypothetical protein